MRRKSGFGKMLIYIICLVIIGLCVFAFIRIYAGIEIKDYKEKNNNGDLLVEDIKNYNIKISDVLESVTPCVVGISKMQNIGNSIFSENSVSTFGIGSGIIVSKNGYIGFIFPCQSKCRWGKSSLAKEGWLIQNPVY